MKPLIATLLFAAAVFAQQTSAGSQAAPPANPLVTVSKGIYNYTNNNILRSIDKVPDNLWDFQPTKDVRTFGQLFAHIADGQYEFCGVVAEGHSVQKGIEKTMKTKAEIKQALTEAIAYCNGAYDKLTDADAATMVAFFGQHLTKLGMMDFNIAHDMEHYGNLVTYMRLKGIVPPSSEGQMPAAAPAKK